MTFNQKSGHAAADLGKSQVSMVMKKPSKMLELSGGRKKEEIKLSSFDVTKT